jgi:hypothetical protein
MIDLADPSGWRGGVRGLPYRHETRSLELADGSSIGLSPILVGMLATLLENEVATSESMRLRCYGGSTDRAPEDEDGCLKVQLVKLRDFLSMVDWCVVNIFGTGFRLVFDPESAMRRRLAAHNRRKGRLGLVLSDPRALDRSPSVGELVVEIGLLRRVLERLVPGLAAEVAAAAAAGGRELGCPRQAGKPRDLRLPPGMLPS